ncbi:hypothetical protein LIER_35155 [Lithospermum erythrorhizon]|uniref:Integrase catalytic domain-containing protein n=1 Tax=Lithospermum erythrorhizon TaxID=34254 RepID=A0AAV3NLV3_LITER
MEHDVSLVLKEAEDWFSPISRYLVYGELTPDKVEARRITNRSYKFRMIQDELYKQSNLGPHLFCLSEAKIDQTLYKLHEGHALALKIIRAGYYWPTIMNDAIEGRPAQKHNGLGHRGVLVENIITRYGIPKVLVSDNGPQFDARVIKEICTRLGIEHRFAPGLEELSGKPIDHTWHWVYLKKYYA